MFRKSICISSPDSKVHGANMGPIWGRQDPGGPHVGPMNFAIWVYMVGRIGSRIALVQKLPWLTRQQTITRSIGKQISFRPMCP